MVLILMARFLLKETTPLITLGLMMLAYFRKTTWAMAVLAMTVLFVPIVANATPVEYKIVFTPNYIHPALGPQGIVGRFSVDDGILGPGFENRSYVLATEVVVNILPFTATHIDSIHGDRIFSVDWVYSRNVEPPISTVLRTGADGDVVDIQGALRPISFDPCCNIILGRDGLEGTFAEYQGGVLASSGTYQIVRVTPRVTPPDASCNGNAATNSTLVEQYYAAILRRPSEAGGKASWTSEADRLCRLGADPAQTFVVMANVFFNTPEYLAFNRDDNGFVTDLYNTFFNRLPDAGGLSYWLSELASGMLRNNVMSWFLLSPEFEATMNSAYPGQTARAETYLVLNLYGGLFRRLAESGGYTYWTGQFRTAQCSANPAAAVQATIDSVSSEFVASAEYAARATTNSQYVADLYYALLQRGAETGGYHYWIGQLDGGFLSRTQVRQQFLTSPEMTAQSAAIAAQGCLH